MLMVLEEIDILDKMKFEYKRCCIFLDFPKLKSVSRRRLAAFGWIVSNLQDDLLGVQIAQLI